MHRLTILFLCIGMYACKPNTTNNNEGFEELWQQMPYKIYTDSIKQFPNNAALYFSRGEELFTHQQLRASLHDYKQAYLLNPSSLYVQAISVNYIQLQQVDSAIKYLQKGIKEFPKDSIFYFQLLNAYTINHEDSLALKMLKPLLEKDSKNELYIDKAVQLYLNLKDTLQAIGLLEKNYHIHKKINDATLQLANLYAETKNKKALELTDKIIDEDSAHYKASAYYLKGIYFVNTNNQQQAIAMFNKSIVHDWTFINAYTDKGVVLFKEKKYTEAEKVFEVSLKVSNTYPDAYYWIGRCQEATGNKTDAAINYRKAISLDKDFEEAKQALKMMN